MILDRVKQYVSDNVGVSHKFVFYGARNQNEEFNGVITKVYPAVFVIILDNGQTRSYSYNDVLISNLKIVD